MGAPGSQPGPGGDRPGPSGPRSSHGHGSAGRGAAARGTRSACRPGSDHGTDTREGSRTAMLRLLHTADVHLGARHADLGEAAAAQRERQFAAFRGRRRPRHRREGRPVPRRRRPVRLERPAASARWSASPPSSPGSPRPASARSWCRARTTSTTGRRSIAPTTSRRMAGTPPGRGDGHRPHAGSPVGPPRRRSTPSSTARASRPSARRTARCTTSPPSRRPTPPGSIGVLHDVRRDPRPHRPRRRRGHGRGDRRQRPRLPRARALALARRSPRPRASPTPTPGAPEPVAVDQDKAGKVLLVTLDVDKNGQQHGRGRAARRRQDDVRAARDRRGDRRVAARPRRRAHEGRATRTSSSTSALIGVRPDDLDLDTTEVEQALRATYLRVRVRDVSHPALTEGALPPAETDRRRVHPQRRGRGSPTSRRPPTTSAAPRGRGAARRPPARPAPARRPRR